MNIEEAKELLSRHPYELPKGVAVTQKQLDDLIRLYQGKPTSGPYQNALTPQGIYSGLPLLVVPDNEEAPEGFMDVRKPL